MNNKTHSRAGRSLFIFGIYLVLLGILLVGFPNFLLNVFGVPSSTEVWIRVSGILVIIIGYYDIQAGRRI